jgi:hypothetical protein
MSAAAARILNAETSVEPGELPLLLPLPLLLEAATDHS